MSFPLCDAYKERKKGGGWGGRGYLRFAHVLFSLVDQSVVTIKDAILRQLHDDDLTVVQAALSLDGLSDMITSSDFFKELQNVLKRCIGSLMSGEFDM